MRQYEMCELAFAGKTPENNWASAAPEALFSCGTIRHTVRGFVAGEGLYKVRFLPEVPGVWTYTVTGEVTASGSVEVLPAAADRHGAVKAVDCHFEHQDGTFFYPFGTTVYALVHQTKELFERTMHTLSTAPFNKIRFCVFPKSYEFNENEPRFYAFGKNPDGGWNVQEPCFDFWDMLDDAILRLDKMGIQSDLILFHPYDRWGFSELSREEDGVYLDYLLRRLSAIPGVWWSMANEYDLFPKKDHASWEFIECFLAENDPFHHLIGNHNCFAFWDHTRKNITHASLQTKMLYRIGEWRRAYGKPICIDECCYEGNIMPSWGSISGREMTARFWRTVVTGGYCTHGETFYDDQDVLWWGKGGELHGESPARIAFLRQITESLPGPIEPAPFFLEGLFGMSEQERKQIVGDAPTQKTVGVLAAGAMDSVEARLYLSTDAMYCGRVGDEAFITFYDQRTCARDELRLPSDRTYDVEVIDVWNMTREVVARNVSGRVTISLPGKEGLALLAIARQKNED